MRQLYEEYIQTLKDIRKSIRKLQKVNSTLGDKIRDIGEEYIYSKNMIDITLLSEMSRDLLYGIESMEYCLPYNERKYLHRKVEAVRRAILSPHSFYGLNPDGENKFAPQIAKIDKIVTSVEMQEDIVGLLDKVLTERQKQVIDMYYFENKTQEQIARELGITKQAISLILQNSIEILRECIKNSDLLDF